MGQSDLENNFNWEREKHFDFFLPYYKSRNFFIHQDNINSKHKNDWDMKVEVFAGDYKTIDEKAIRGEFNNFLLELMQDLKTGNLGWFFHETDLILYGSWKELEKKEPNSLFLVNCAELKNHLLNFDGFIKTCISKKGWGTTWNIILEWPELLNKKIAERLI